MSVDEVLGLTQQHCAVTPVEEEFGSTRRPPARTGRLAPAMVRSAAPEEM